jgi:dTDP-4-amino-4,6-dideoxygalactose transaminase
MRESDIESRDWWASGLHKMPAFSDRAERIYSDTDELAAQTVGLPLYVDMSDEDIDRVLDVLSRAPGDTAGIPLARDTT